MKNNITVVGTGWGDEGKGKVLDFLSKDADYVVRFNGGPNAGHTVVVKGQKFVFHLVPSSILNSNCTSIIGAGTVLDLETLYKELTDLAAQGIKLNLKISPLAHIITSLHKELDAQQETGINPIGTTKRGIGPCYADKARRTGIRLLDLFDESSKAFKSLIYFERMNEELLRKILVFLKPFVADTQTILQTAIKNNQRILFEGAQGLMLDIDNGTYPYVTSSTTHPAYAAASNGIPVTALGEVWGISKAYTTRVGNGPFPTELDNELGEHLRKAGNEFGSTTGRPRRCGWLDLVQLKYAVKMAGVQKLVLTKLDILSEMDNIQVCTGYDDRSNHLSYGIQWDKVKPQYQTLPAFPKIDWKKIKEWADLPQEIQNYVKLIEDFIEVSVEYISFGPERDSLLEIGSRQIRETKELLSSLAPEAKKRSQDFLLQYIKEHS